MKINLNNFKLREHIITYSDMTIRGLLAFIFIGVGLYIFLVGFLHIKAMFVLPFAFLVSILVSPFLSRIKLGEKLIIKYEKFLDNLISNWKKNGK